MVHLLSSFEKDFPSDDPTSDPNIGPMVREAGMRGRPGSPSMFLYALSKDLHAKVSIPSVSLPLNFDKS